MKGCITWYLISAMFVIGIAPRVEAAFSPSEALILTPSERAMEIEKVQNLLEHKIVRQRLEDLGFSSDEITSRLSQLSDEQLHTLAMKIDDLKVGRDGLGVVIVVLVIIALVLLIIQLSGKRVVVTN